MGAWNKAGSVGMALGVALFVAFGLIALVAARPGGSDLKAGPIDPAVAAPAEQLGKAFAMVAAHVRPAVVSVFSEKTVKFQAPDFGMPFGNDFFRQFFGRQFPQNQPQPMPREYSVPQQGMGSGMIIDKQGHVLTNYHVVSDVDEIKVQLADKTTFEAEIVSSDPQTDVAVIRMKGSVPDDLPAVEFGDSDAMEVGDLVMAIGAPFGFQQTVTTGIISAKGRSGVGINTYEDFLQTDAAINPGNSGGPLVNMRGQVIGMNSAIATHIGQFAGVGFAIPINLIKGVLPTLVKGGKVTHGMLGVKIQEVTPELAKLFGLTEAKGALVAQVVADSAADKGGIKAGDVIVRYDGKDVESPAHLRNMVAATAPDTEVKVGIIRGGKQETLTLRVGTLTPQMMAEAAPSEEGGVLSKLGMSVQTLTPDLAKQFGIRAAQGAVITDVEEGGAASLAGLQAGDLIVEADRRKVASAGDLQEALDSAKDKDTVLLLVKRKSSSLFVALKTK
ncbi:MAG: Do family serine endopeptidase [Candidatus Brocadiia bacterium]